MFLSLLSSSFGQRNDWTVVTTHPASRRNLTLLGLEGDSLLVSGKEGSSAIPVSTIRTLEHPEGNSPRSLRLITGSLIGAGSGFMIGTVIDAMNHNANDNYSFLDGDYKLYGVVSGAILGGMIGAGSSSSGTRKFDIAGMDLDAKEKMISAILSTEGKETPPPLAVAPGNVVHLKSGTDVTGTIVELFPDSSVKVCTADSSLFVFTMSEIASIDTIATNPATPANIVYLKNGSVIKSALIRFIPDSSLTVRTREGILLHYGIKEVSRVGLDTAPPPGITRRGEMPRAALRDETENYPHIPRPRFGLHAGLSLPTGDFSSNGESGGDAGAGYCFGADMYVGEDVGWYTSATLAINTVDQSKMDIPSSIGTDFGSWSSIWLMSGMRGSTPIGTNTQVYGFGQVGILFGGWPDIHIFYLGQTVSETASSSTALGFGFGAGVTYEDKYSLGMRFYGANPEYTVTISGGGISGSAKGKQSTTMVLLNFEILF